MLLTRARDKQKLGTQDGSGKQTADQTRKTKRDKLGTSREITRDRQGHKLGRATPHSRNCGDPYTTQGDTSTESVFIDMYIYLVLWRQPSLKPWPFKHVGCSLPCPCRW